MNWSLYNYLFNNQENYYLYNSYTNNLIQFDSEFNEVLLNCKNHEFDKVSTDILDTLEKEKILVDNDEDIYNNIKLKRTISRFNSNILALTIAPTTACNFRCIYCYETGIECKTISKSTDFVEDIIKFAKSFPYIEHLFVTWYGGEPLLKFDFIESLSIRFKKEFAQYSANMITNGYLLNENIILKLKNLHINMLQITIDGMQSTHNKRRPHAFNSDSFQTIIKNLDCLFRLYPEVGVALRVNVDKSNSGEYHELYKFLSERYDNCKINIHPGWVTDEFSIEPNCDCLTTLERTSFLVEQSMLYNIPVKLFPSSEYGECSARHINSFVIGPEGEVYKCWNDIGKLDKNIGNIKDFSIFNSICTNYMFGNDPLASNRCKKCFCFPICNGGCPYSRINNAKHYEKDFCDNRENMIKDMIFKSATK